jgi:hypothetical protein
LSILWRLSLVLERLPRFLCFFKPQNPELAVIRILYNIV